MQPSSAAQLPAPSRSFATLPSLSAQAVFFSSHGSVSQAWRDGCCNYLWCGPRFWNCWYRVRIEGWNETADRLIGNQQHLTSSMSEPWSPLGAVWHNAGPSCGGNTRDEEMPSPVSDPTLEVWWDSWRRESDRSGVQRNDCHVDVHTAGPHVYDRPAGSYK